MFEVQQWLRQPQASESVAAVLPDRSVHEHYKVTDCKHGSVSDPESGVGLRRSICLFLLNQDFQRRTEQMLAALHGSAHEAEQALGSVFGGLSQAQVRQTLDLFPVYWPALCTVLLCMLVV